MGRSPRRFTILMPIYNDWQAASHVITQIDAVFVQSDLCLNIILVDDGSTSAIPDDFLTSPLRSIASVELLRLRRNLGHQRAIAIGLTHVFQNAPCDAVVVLDSDGQDRPEDIPRLIEKFLALEGTHFIFAKRAKRPENLIFRIGYQCYRALHKTLTGLGIQVGNFSVIPFQGLSSLVVSSELWNHYAAAVFKLRLPISTLPAPRAPRFSGETKMNLVSLVIHGLSAISVFSEIVGTRTIVAAGVLSTALISLLMIVVGVRFFTGLPVPDWATYSSGFVLVLLFLIFAIASSFLLFVLGNRNTASFLPIRDYSFFIEKSENITPGGKGACEPPVAPSAKANA